MDIFFEQRLENRNFAPGEFKKGEYEDCVFVNCDFTSADITEVLFTNCEFTACNLSNVHLTRTAFRAVHFIDCKLIGLRFEYCTDFLFEVSFTRCNLDFSSFYKRKLKNTHFSSCSLQEVEFGEELNEFKELMLRYWDENLTRVFTKKRDIQIADAVLELFRRSQHIENFNKKHLYLLIREMTDCKTHYITKVVNEMKKHQTKMFNDYLDHGMIVSKSNDFWEEQYLLEQG